MRALIIGAAGFVGGYLIDELTQNFKWEVFATKLPFEFIENTSAKVIDVDILNETELSECINCVQPDIIYHLAAQSSVAVSWKKPAMTADINIKGAINLLEGVRTIGKKPRVILIGSSEEYGNAAKLNMRIDESVIPEPGNIYALTKYTQNMLGGLYARAYGLDVIMVRAFNHIGPGQHTRFVVADFCNQAAEIEAGLREPVIYVGNLSAKRDFSDVRDIVRAYSLLGVKGKSGETYNVGSGKAISIRYVLDEILKQSLTSFEIKVDPERFRPIDIPMIEADITKLQQCTGYKPTFSFQKSLSDILDYQRNQIRYKSN